MDLFGSIGLIVVLRAVIMGAAWGWTKWTGRQAAVVPRPDHNRQVLSSPHRIEMLLAVLAAVLLVHLPAW